MRESRDTKGLYRKAELGEIENLVGVSPNVPFEVPDSANITIDTNEVTAEEGTEILLSCIGKWQASQQSEG